MARQRNQGATKTNLTCAHCGKTLSTEKWLERHSCIYKKRWEVRDSRVFQIAYDAWLSLIGSMRPCPYKDKSIKKFIKSIYFNPCILLAKQIIEYNIPNHKKMIWWICNYQQFPMNQWGTDKTYLEYVKYRKHNESIEHAVSRSINAIKVECDKREKKVKDFFSLSPNLITAMLIDGRLSPWMLFICNTASEYTKNVTDDHKRMLAETLDPNVWNKKRLMYTKEINEYKNKFKKVEL